MGMNRLHYTPPTLRESLAYIIALAVWLGVTAAFIGFRPEHIFLALLIAGLFFGSGNTRRLVVALIPFALFGISYDWMNLCHNYDVNPVDTIGLYSAEKAVFGIDTARWGLLTPNEFLSHYTSPVLDFLGGVFYLCWVPVPIIFGLWLYFTGRRSEYLHFAMVFLLVNLIGFCIYYIHPAAPPWYIESHGFVPVIGTQGEVAGLGAFDRMTGLSIFEGLYARNSNIFAALPSLHSAYTLVALIYAVRYRVSRCWIAALAVITAGIWCTAVYTFHHYVIDVLAGIAVAFAGYIIFEYLLMRWGAFARFVQRYTKYISYGSGK